MYIELKNINKSFGDFQASNDVSFQIEKGKLVALLGPSGSGKTTILRMIAGLEHQDSGDIWIDGKLVNDIPVQERGIGFVFQSYALFPYLTVFDNIAYGMKVRKKSKEEIETKVAELLELVDLKGLGDRYPDQLSGGQRQRVAFARALATEPQVLLLDEPFAAIDAKVRKELRKWLKQMIEQVGITSIFVTHDQDEAVEVADELIVTNHGRVEQMGTPVEIYQSPKTPFVAQFIGESVVLDNYAYEKISGFSRSEGAACTVIRPEFVKITPIQKNTLYPRVNMLGTVTHTAFRGNSMEVHVRVKGIDLIADTLVDEASLKVGDEVNVMVSRMYAFNDTEAFPLINSALIENGEIYHI